MKAKIIQFVDSPNDSFTGTDGSQVKATALTIDVNGQALTYITFAQKMEVGEEIDYELRNDKKGNSRLKILRPQQENYSKDGGGKSMEQYKLELLGRACNQAAQLATKDGTFNATVANEIISWIKEQLNAKAQPQAPPVATPQTQAAQTESEDDPEMPF